MWFKYPFIILLFFIASLLQVSFFPYFAILGVVPNLIFALFFIIIFFESQNTYFEGFFVAIIAGFFSDMLLPLYFGISMIAFLAVYFLHKLINYFLREDQNKYLVFYFFGLFSLSFIIYSGLIYLFSLLLHFEFSFGLNVLISLVYNLPFACIGFYVGRKIFSKIFNNQLKLL